LISLARNLFAVSVLFSAIGHADDCFGQCHLFSRLNRVSPACG
jgi:hypothetical protein